MDITLTFDNYNGGAEDGVRVYRADTPMSDGSMPAPLATIAAGSTSYTDSTVTRGNKYYYRFGIFKGSDEVFTPNRCIRAVTQADTGPGPQKLIMGDWDMGYFGLTKSADLITYLSLGSFLNITTGSTRSEYDWLKVAYKGKVLYIARNVARYDLTFNALYQAGAVYGTNDNGVKVPTGATATNQYKPITIAGTWTVFPRIWKGLADADTPASNTVGVPATAFNPNEFDDIMSMFIVAPRYTGDVSGGGFTRFDSEFWESMSTSNCIGDFCQMNAQTPAGSAFTRGGRFQAFPNPYPGAIVYPFGTTLVNPATGNYMGGSGQTVHGAWRPILELVL